jgi:hypothetical protein
VIGDSGRRSCLVVVAQAAVLVEGSFPSRGWRPVGDFVVTGERRFALRALGLAARAARLACATAGAAVDRSSRVVG